MCGKLTWILLFGVWVGSLGCSDSLRDGEKAELAFADGDFLAVVQHSTAGLIDDPDSERLLGLRGMALLKTQRPAEALVDLVRVLGMTGDSTWLVYTGECYSALDSFGMALENFNGALAFDSTLVNAYRGRGRAYAGFNRCDLAVPDFLRFGTMNGQDFGALNSLGLCYKALGDYDKAERCFRDCLTLDSTNWVVYYNLSELKWTRGDTITALELNRTALALSDDWDGLLLRERGKMLYMQFGADTACPLWEAASRLGDEEAIQLLGEYCSATESNQ
jgi:tetratricopeptide (TPR) repeat protein